MKKLRLHYKWYILKIGCQFYERRIKVGSVVRYSIKKNNWLLTRNVWAKNFEFYHVYVGQGLKGKVGREES